MGLREDLSLDVEEDRLKFVSESEGHPTVFLSEISNLFSTLTNIRTLEISNASIKQIPDSIQGLNLRELILSKNKLNEVPSCLYSGLESLELLDLSHNSLKSFEIEPACHRNLVTLNVANNKIFNFPHWILTLPCPKLQEVDYSHNFLTKIEPTEKITLKKLVMKSSKMRDQDFQFLRNIETLECLNVGNDGSMLNENKFTHLDKLFEKIKWKNLFSLNLSNLNVSVVPKEIFSIYTLKELYLTNCELTWIPVEIEFLHNLILIDVSNNSICGLPTQLLNLPHLQTIRAQRNTISSIDNLNSDLQVLDLYENQLLDLPQIDRIKYVDLELNYLDTTLLYNYESKRDGFRKDFGLIRLEGPIMLPTRCSSSGDESDYTSLDDADNEDSERDECWSNENTKEKSQPYDDECWNDEYITENIKYEKHPQITTSDDEWDGREEAERKVKRTICKFHYDEDEDWIFEDVEGF